MPVLLGLQPLMEIPEVTLQVFSILFLGDSIHADRCVLAHPFERPPKSCHIDVVSQRREPASVAPRCFRYPYKSR
jgi:hypothetical protein